MMDTIDNEKKIISFEENINNAKILLEQLMEQDITLEKSMKIYNKGLEELDAARKLLDEAKFQFEELQNKG